MELLKFDNMSPLPIASLSSNMVANLPPTSPGVFPLGFIDGSKEDFNLRVSLPGTFLIIDVFSLGGD